MSLSEVDVSFDDVSFDAVTFSVVTSVVFRLAVSFVQLAVACTNRCTTITLELVVNSSKIHKKCIKIIQFALNLLI